MLWRGPAGAPICATQHCRNLSRRGQWPYNPAMSLERDIFDNALGLAIQILLLIATVYAVAHYGFGYF